MAISRQEEALSRDYALLLFQMTSRVLYSAQYHRQHCTLQAFEQFVALYLHNHDTQLMHRFTLLGYITLHYFIISLFLQHGI